MKVEYKLFAGLLVFFVPITFIYGYVTNWTELVGLVGLLLCTLMVAMIAFYVLFTGRKLDFRPEDNPDGEIAEAEGDYGFFSPHSWWPLFLALCAAILFVGVAIPNGWWIFLIGAVFGAVALIGWTFEYYTGEHSQ